MLRQNRRETWTLSFIQVKNRVEASLVYENFCDVSSSNGIRFKNYSSDFHGYKSVRNKSFRHSVPFNEDQALHAN